MKEKIFCPKCGSEDAQPLLGFTGFTGQYKCRDCEFEGIFPIKEKIKKSIK